MKKIFQKIGKKKNSKEPAPPESPIPGAAAGHAGSQLGYEVREKDLPKLLKSAWTGDLAKVKQYVKKDPNTLDKENRTALHLACVAGRVQVVKELLEWGAKTNLGDADSKSPLLKAVECNQEECVTLLLEHRANVDAVDKDGDTCLHIAVRHNYTNVVKVLLRNGAGIDKKNKDGNAPLHISCKGKKPEITRILLTEKANVDISDINGRTPLMHACYEGSISHVQLLIQYNANTLMKDVKGFAAEDIAMMRAQHGCVQLIHDQNMRLRRSGGGGSANTTPRSSLPPSASATPRDASITPDFGLPQQQNSDDESGDETVSKISTGGDFGGSWGDDTDVSLSTDVKKGKEDKPKISLAKALNNLPADNVSDDGGEGSVVPPKQVAGKRNSARSLKSQTSVEEDWSDDEEQPQSARTPRVTFKTGKDISETIEITGDEADTDEDEEVEDDDDEEYVHAKRPKMDNRASSNGYTPTAIAESKPMPLSQQQHQGNAQSDKQREEGGKPGEGALLNELGLEDMSEGDLSDPEFPSEVSDSHLPHSEGIMDSEEEEPEPVTPGPSILKNWKHHSQEQVEEKKMELQKQQNVSKKSDQESEWDSELEDTLDPEKSEDAPVEVRRPHYIDSDSEEEIPEKQVLKTSHWDSSADIMTPRELNNHVVNVQTTKTISEFIRNDFEDEDIEDVDDVDFVQEVPLETVDAVIQEANTTGSFDGMSTGTHDSGHSGSGPQTVIENVIHHTPKVENNKREEQQKMEADDDDDSDWDSDEENLPSETNAPPVYTPSPVPVTKPVVLIDEEEDDDDDDDETESVSEWELERIKEKELKQKLEEEEEERRAEELERQRQWEEEEKRRQDQLKREAEEEELLRQQEEEEELIRQEEEEQQRLEEQRRQEHLKQKQLEEQRRQEQLEEQQRQKQLEEQRRQEQLKQKQREEQQRQEQLEEARRQEEEQRKLQEEEAARQIKLEAEKQKVPEHAPLGTGSEEAEKRRQDIIKKLDEMDEMDKSFDSLKGSQGSSDKTPPKKNIKSPVTPPSAGLEFKTSPLGSTSSEDVIEKHTSFGVSAAFTGPQRTVGHEIEQEAMIKSEIKPESAFKSEIKPDIIVQSQINPVRTQPKNTSKDTGIESGNVSHTAPPPSKPSPGPFSRSSPLINASPAAAMSLQSDGMSLDDDDSDLEPERSDMGTYLKNLPTSFGYSPYKGLETPDDDVMSFTSTENGESSAYTANLPYGKDVLASMNLSDPGTVIKLQEHLRDQRKLLDQERNHRTTIESKHKSIVKEKVDLQKKIDSLNYQRQTLEQAKLDLEQKIRNLEYNLNEETEMRKNAEILLNKTKEQLERKEEQYTGEMEFKQKLELQIRNLQMELRSSSSAVKQLEDEKESLSRQYQHEKSARQLQEQLNDEQQKLQQQLHDEQIKSVTQKSDAENRYEAADEERKHTHDNLDKTRAELIALRRELDRQRSRFKDENALLSTENEELQRKIEELKNEIKLNEDALAHATVQYNLQISNSRTEVSVLNGQMDRERAGKEKVEAELESLKNRFHSASLEFEKSEQARSELERRFHDEKENWIRAQDTKDKEGASLKENAQGLLHRLHATESKLNSVENELHISNTTLLERSNMLQQSQKDVQYYKSAQDNYDQNYKVEKELNGKLQIKVETLQEKNTNLQHDNLSLKQQLESTQQALSDKSGNDAQEKVTAMLTSLKTEHEKTQHVLEERNTSLTETVTRLREEIRSSEGRRNNVEQELSRFNREYNDLIRKLSMAEASLDVALRTKESLEQERGQLKLEVEKLHQKYEMAHEKSIESQARIAEMVDRLERSEQNNLYNNQQLLNTSANMEAFSKTKEDLESSFQKMQVENVKLQAELNHEKQRAEMLHKDLQDSQRVRNSLEELCSNLKSSKAQLEEKVGHEHGIDEMSVTRSLITQEAESHKDLWEQEVISRSKLGLRISQYEKQKQEAFTQVEEEKRKCRKALEAKRIAETKMEAEQNKSLQLQKEVANLKAYLKVAKKRLKVVDKGDTRLGTLNADFDMERVAMEGTLASVKQQMEDLRRQLQEEMDGKSQLQTRNLQLENELSSLKNIQGSLKELERNKKQLEHKFKAYKSKIENGFVDRDELEQTKKELEARYRMELNRKLDEVNGYLEEQARSRDKLDTSRDESEYKLKDVNKKLQEENMSLRIKFEQIVAQKDSKDMEAKRFKDLYESEMQWRMRLSEQLMRSSDRAMSFKTNAERQKTRMFGNLGNLTFSGTMNGQMLDSSRFSSGGDDILGNRLKAELDRSIAKHLEAAPHENIKPFIRSGDDPIMNSTFAKSNAEYLDLLKRKYCV